MEMMSSKLIETTDMINIQICNYMRLLYEIRNEYFRYGYTYMSEYINELNNKLNTLMCYLGTSDSHMREVFNVGVSKLVMSVSHCNRQHKEDKYFRELIIKAARTLIEIEKLVDDT